MCCSYGIEIVGLMLNQGKFQKLKHCSMYSTKNLTGLALFLVLLFIQQVVSIDYGAALTKSLLYYEAQRSGKLPPNQRVEWRGDSGLNDGSDVGTDLVGGYHDAGDNIKFGFPMAFTTTMLAWGVVEFGNRLEAKQEFFNAMQAIKWVTDYMIKAHPQPNVFYGQVGEGDSDHNCWQRPEDMTTLRTAYKIDAEHPGSDLAAETAAALAAASIAFSKCCPFYSSLLVNHSKQLFDFACNYQDLYQNSIPEAARFYYSSGYQDELLWAAAWLHRATGNQSYIDYLASASELSGHGITLSWDNKYVGASILVAKLVLEGKVKNDGIWLQYLNYAEEFVCSCIQKGNNNVKMTPGGLLWWDLSWNSLQYTTSAALAIVAYSDYLNATKVQLQCQGGLVYPADLIAFARSQVDYILGLNPKNMSYMVGFGTKYPEQVHHRGSSIVSIKKDPTHVTCAEGFMRYFHNDAPNPNMLEGALVGGPDENDRYNDSRLNIPQAEASTYITAPFIGVLARVSD